MDYIVKTSDGNIIKGLGIYEEEKPNIPLHFEKTIEIPYEGELYSFTGDIEFIIPAESLIEGSKDSDDPSLCTLRVKCSGDTDFAMEQMVRIEYQSDTVNFTSENIILTEENIIMIDSIGSWTDLTFKIPSFGIIFNNDMEAKHITFSIDIEPTTMD